MYVTIIDLQSSLTWANYKVKKTEKRALEGNYCQTQKTANTWKISGMLIVYWPITIKFRIRKQTSNHK